jgi:DinB superfamily
MLTLKERFLNTYEHEHATTMRVLRAMPESKLDLRPHPKCKSARELAWVFALERGLGLVVFKDGLATGQPPGTPPAPPAVWADLLAGIDRGHVEFGDLVRSTPDEQLEETITFFTAPKTLGGVSRLDFCWFMLMDEIHHRGQFSIYLRMADAKVPSIYGPTADEPWM